MKALIIEDEIMAVQRLTKMLGELDKKIEIVTDLDTITASIQWLKTNEMPDVVFLDIHLADGLSFEIFKSVDITCPIIFTTAYDQYAIQAFKVNAIDYLLKPIKKAELERSLEKFYKIQAPPIVDYRNILQSIQEKTPQQYQKRFLIRYGQKYKIVEVAEIAYCFIQDKIVFACTADGKHYPMDYNLDKLETMLSPDEFYRINRQVLARSSAIRELYAFSKSRVKVELQPKFNEDVIVSKERTSKFKEWLIGR